MTKINISRWLKCKYWGLLLVSSNSALSTLTLICYENQLKHMHTKHEDLTGQQFEKLTVVKQVESTKTGRAMWLCKCTCGNTTVVRGVNLISGNTTSCGCNKKLGVVTHGKSDTILYHKWQGMKTRCTNTNSNRYQYYGGKGICYDPRWETFESFYEDMHEGYEIGSTLDRIDHNKGYSKENCRWVDYTVQNNNKADNVHLLYNGIKYTVQEVANVFGISTYSVYNRKRRGWSDKKIIETPINTKHVNKRHQKV